MRLGPQRLTREPNRGGDLQDRVLPIAGRGRTALTQQVAIERDWWDIHDAGSCVWAAYQAKGAANFAASLIDLTGNGNNAGDPGGLATPGWGPITGWTFDGIQQYLTTTFVPAIDQSQSVLVQFTNATPVSGTFLFGSRVGADRWWINPNTGLGQHRYRHGSLADGFAPDVAAGNLAIAGAWGYYTGVADAGPLAGYGAPPASVVYIGCENNAGVPASFIFAYIQAFALYDCTLTAGQVFGVAAAMSAL